MRHSTPWHVRFLSQIILVSMLSTFLPMQQVAEAIVSTVEPEIELEAVVSNPGGGLATIRNINPEDTRYGLVAILVESGLYGSNRSFQGLSSGFSIARNTLARRVDRYAEDIQSAMPYTKAMVVEVDRNTSPVEIQKMLELLYFEGNPDDSDLTRLVGTVIVGDVPLPVVNKNGHRFISMMPYTDFEEPSYLVDNASQDFVRNEEAQNLQAEIWHGLLVPPLSGEAGEELLASYFDKNHAFHTGEEDFTDFNQKVFIGDFVTEEATLNEVSFKSYDRFIEYWEELAYYRYSNDMVEQIYIDISESAEPGDGLDNDGDGSPDEEAANGRDDDGDGLIDEDIGDGFYQIDNDQDGQIDEDGLIDNNNDRNYNFYTDNNLPFFKDRDVDEDPPGDANGDGCPGVCGVDDNGNSEDHDDDGFPTGWELAHDYPWDDNRRPFRRPSTMANDLYGKSFSKDEAGDEEATAFLASFYIDEDYSNENVTGRAGYGHVSCFDSEGFFHGEWDDDEDGFCDEDGGEEISLWNLDGTFPATRSCVYNDADCDGTIDEDPEGRQPAPLFEELPDIQSKALVDQLVSRYVEIFEQPQGVWNRLVEGSGRYQTRQANGPEVQNDFDTAISLIAKKDEETLIYLRNVNDLLESKVNQVVDVLQEPIPVIAAMEVRGSVTYDPVDDKDAVVEDICISNKNVGASDSCPQFVNHSLNTKKLQAKNINAGNVKIFGHNFESIQNTYACTGFAGSFEDGQFVKYDSINSKTTQEAQAEDFKSFSEEKEYKGCLLKNTSFLKNNPNEEVCFSAIAEKPVKAEDGAVEFDSPRPLGYPACYEYRELETFNTYRDVNGAYSDWLTKEVRKEDDNYTSFDEFIHIMNAEKEKTSPNATRATLTKEFNGIVLWTKDTENRNYTLLDFFKDYFDDPTLDRSDQNDLNLFMTFRTSATVENPTKNGTPLAGVDKIQVLFDKFYIGTQSFLGGIIYKINEGPAGSRHIPSTYYHVEPTDETLNLQMADGATPNLPIDNVRGVSFMDATEKYRRWDYVNVFDAERISQVDQQIDTLEAALSDTAGGAVFKDDIRDYFDEEINRDQLIDSIRWAGLSIDEKHAYVFSHYLGEEEPVFAKARDGYEIFSLIADGTASELEFSFNGAKPTKEDNLLFKYRDQAVVDEVLSQAFADAAADAEESYDALAQVDNTTPVTLIKWMDEIRDWLQDTQDSVTNFDAVSEFACGSPLELGGSQNHGDLDENGVPDNADDTVTIQLTSEDNSVLQANGLDHYIVTASARRSDGSVNTSDSYTQVELEIPQGLSSVAVSGNVSLRLTGGVATFALKSLEPGSFRVRVVPENRDDLSASNNLNGSVTAKFVKVTSYQTDIRNVQTVEQEGNNIEVYDEAGGIVAVLNPESGDLNLRNAQAILLEASESLPTRISIQDFEGGIHGSFFLIPEVKEVSIGTAVSGVLVDQVGSNVQALKIDDYVVLRDNGVEIGRVTGLGQIALADGYRLEFQNPGEINVYEPIQILNGRGVRLFEVTVKHGYDEAQLLELDGEYAPYNAISFWPLGKRGRLIPTERLALAAVSIPDTDNDLLDDLEELTVGTDRLQSDTDGDGFKDGTEIFSGFDPRVGDGAPLFTDIDSGHPAYHDVAVLYLRGVLRGYSDRSYRPDNPLTREEFVQVNLGAICVTCRNFSPEYRNELFTEYATDAFPDTDINPELLACVAEAKTRGLVSGYEAGAQQGFFVPGQFISRAEATKVLVETAGLPVSAPGTDEAWYASYVRTAQANGLFPEGRFSEVDDFQGAQFDSWFRADQAGSQVFKNWLEGIISRSEFAEMAVNFIETQDCRAVDSDSDGLADTEEEFIYGTDPNNADSDGGGVPDLDEIVRGSDPLDPADDLGAVEVPSGEDFSGLSDFDHAPGLYGVGDDITVEQISSATGEGDDGIKIFTKEVAADGESQLFVQAEIRDQEDNVYVNDNSSVIEFILSNANHAVLATRTVQVKKGRAETVLVSKKIAGEVTVEARITDGSLPSRNALVQVYPGKATRINITGDSTVLPAGGEAISNIRASLFDNFNNLANYGFATITLEAEGGIELLDLVDEDLNLDGIQVTTPDGFVDFRVLASPLAGEATISGTLMTPGGRGDEYTIDHIEGMSLRVISSVPMLFAGGVNPREMSVRAVDSAGRVVTGFQGQVRLSMNDPSYGQFQNDTISLGGGEGSAQLTPGTLAGLASIVVESPGITSGSTSVEVDPADPYELRIRKEDGTFLLESGKNGDFLVELFDEYGNFIDNDSSTKLTLALTPGTAEYGELNKDEVTLSQGSASFRVRASDVSGKVNLMAIADDLLVGTWSGDVKYLMDSQDFSEIQPQMLYGSLLGGPFGDITQEDYIAGWMTFNGKTQAVTSLVSDPQPKARVATIDALGSVTLPSGSLVTQTVLSAGSSLPVRVQWRSYPSDRLQAEIIYKLPATGDLMSAELLGRRTDLELEEKDGGLVLREDRAVAVKIRADGQIEVLDPNYSLAINSAANGLSFAVSRTTEPVLRIDFHDAWEGDVNLLESTFDFEDWSTLSPGIYVRPTVASKSNFVPIPSGNSSNNPIGLALINPKEDLPSEQTPSLGFAGLEKAGENGGIGWEDENKHLLLFAAGNSAGDSNRWYSSEIGVLLGDPTIAVLEPADTNDLGFTSDVGQMVYADNDNILTLLDIDYNGDGLEDVLVAYEDGRIDVLQNYDAATRLQPRGTILDIENEIRSIDKGDFNGDGLDDLFIVTKTACREGEICLYVFENIGGGFVAKYLDLEDQFESNPTQIEVADLNNDDFDDLVIFDESMFLYVVWNARGTLDTVKKLENNGFALVADPDQELNTDVAVNFVGLEGGGLNLAIPSVEYVSPDNVETDLDDFLDVIGSDNDFTVNVDGSGDADVGSVNRTKTVSFDYANSPAVSSKLVISKSVTDLNGGRIEMGDTLSYRMKVRNISGATLQQIHISDYVGDYFTFQKDSVIGAIPIASNNIARPFMVGPFGLPNNQELILRYEVKVNKLPSMNIMVANDFYDDYKDDDFLDIAVSPEGNQTGELVVFTSNTSSTISIEGGGLFGSNYKQINYLRKEYSPSAAPEEYDTTIEDPFADANGDGTPDLMEDVDFAEGVPVPDVDDPALDPYATHFGAVDSNHDGLYDATEMFKSVADSDGDGLNDTVDSWNSSADAEDYVLSGGVSFEDGNLELDIVALDESVEELADGIEEIISTFTCNGGCISFLPSIAFLAPGNFHDPFFGTKFSPKDRGTPIFGILPQTPVVCSGQTCYASNVMRLYLAPTTTLGLGAAICLGPYGQAGQCYAFALPIAQALGVCDAINGFVADSLSKATSFSAEADAKIFKVSAEGSTGTPSGMSSTIFDGYTPPVATQKNISAPGFPEVFTTWWTNQKFEFYQMLDLPDITFVIPDEQSLTQEFEGFGRKDTEENQVEKLETNVQGLEKFVNMAHSWPLVDIQPEPVYFRYPAFTPEEIEFVEQDFQDWINDAKNLKSQLQRTYDNLIEEYPELQSDLESARDEVVSEVEEIIGAMENNMAVIEDYSKIPEEILKIRELQAYYAKIVICYIDAVLSFTAGYLLENANRMEAWAQWVEDLKTIVVDWQGLIEVSVKMMDSCDKCTNQRYSGFQFLASLFVFLPEPPVVKMPKWPDIILDVSNIQAGVDIVWPDVVFVPENINIPDLPRLSLPVLDIDTALNFEIDTEIPVLPDFNLLFDLPELPGLPLPDLPDIPPPPAIPDLDPNVSATLNIASSIVQVICIIRQGFIPVPEMDLKTKIEEITQRPATLLPIDLRVTAEAPNIDFDFLERIEINTYLNLTPEFTGLYDIFQNLSDLSNDLVTDLTGEFEDVLKESSSAVEDATTLEIEDETFETEVDIDLTSHQPNIGQELAYAYKDHPLVQANLMAFQQNLVTLNEEVEAWSANVPENYELVATQRYLALDDPLLNRYDEIISGDTNLDTNFLASIEDTPLASLAVMRESMIAYVGDLEAGTQRLENMDGEAFNRYLAQEQEQRQPRFLLASSDGSAGLNSADQWNPEMHIVEGGDVPVILADHGSDHVSSVQAQRVNNGIYIYNDTMSTKLVDYGAELKRPMSILFMDVDDDGDEDVVYSMGGDVYVKENTNRNVSPRYVSSDPRKVKLAEIVPDHGAVKNLKRGNNSNEEASFAFNAAEEAVGYEAVLYDSLDAQEAAPDENIKRVVLLSSPQNDPLPVTNESGDSFGPESDLIAVNNSEVYRSGSDVSLVVPAGHSTTLPTLRQSRVVATNLSGRVSLLNGKKRTPVRANSEIASGDSLTFQVLEKSQFKIRKGGQTVNMDVPVNTLVTFPRSSDRVLRLESGKALWIQDEIIDEQKFEEDWEVFATELIRLDGRGADVELTTSEGAVMELDAQEIFVMDRLINVEDPSTQVALENGAYYMQLRGIFEGGLGTISENVLLNPQICADDSPPYPILSDSEIDLAIFTTRELSAENSFDSDSEIVDAFWDLDASVDVNGDGIPNNDPELTGLVAQIGPYDTVDQKEVTLSIVDGAGNSSSAVVTVNIIVPDIAIDGAEVENGVASNVYGHTIPDSPNFPFHLIRERQGALQEIGAGYFTDENGDWLENLNVSEGIYVFDESGNVIAEFNPPTKQLLVFNERYFALALPSGAAWPARLVVADKVTGAVMGSFIIVSDNDRLVAESPEPLADIDLSNQRSVTVHVVADEEHYELQEGAFVGVNDEGVVQFKAKQDGNILLFNQDLEIVKRPADSLEEYLVIELYDDGVLELEIYPGSAGEVTITSTEELGLPESDPVIEFEDISGDFRQYFEDIPRDDPLFADIANLVERQVLSGFIRDGQQFFHPNQPITRAEFTKIILGTLCIVPGEDAYVAPNVFNDILDPSLWFFPFTKESATRDIITGYIGETDANGLTPFKPGNTINRAEAVKIMLEAMDKQGIITLPEDLVGEPWYAPYMEIAQDISPYLVAESAGEVNFIVTPEEAADPAHVITRYEFVEMSSRALQAFNCFEIDSDEDGIPNFDEESIYGTDPFNPDTDFGGVDDGTEIGRGSNPLDPEDDFPPEVDLGLDEGIYGVQEPCITCPCKAGMDFAADLRVGDQVFAIIQNALGEIFASSNRLTIRE